MMMMMIIPVFFRKQGERIYSLSKGYTTAAVNVITSFEIFGWSSIHIRRKKKICEEYDFPCRRIPFGYDLTDGDEADKLARRGEELPTRSLNIVEGPTEDK